MPTRIKPDREGYSGYTCVGIPRPCIDPMDGVNNRFNCLPKAATKIVTNVPYVDLGNVALDATMQATLATTNTHYDPLNDGAFIDLYNAFRRTGFDKYIDHTCNYVYACSEAVGIPPESISKRQISFSVGFMDPPITGIDAIGVSDPDEDEVSSNSSSSNTSSSGGSSLSSDAGVTVITDLRLTAAAVLEYKTTVIYVTSETEGAWTTVPGWATTDCDVSSGP